MLNEIYIGGFKAFDKTQKIPLKPITLIYGPNSSGKSTILHNFLLMNHAMTTGNFNVHHTRKGGNSVDLGGFSQYRHRSGNSSGSFFWGGSKKVRYYPVDILLSEECYCDVSINIEVNNVIKVLHDKEKKGNDVSAPSIIRYRITVNKIPFIDFRMKEGVLQITDINTDNNLVFNDYFFTSFLKDYPLDMTEKELKVFLNDFKMEFIPDHEVGYKSRGIYSKERETLLPIKVNYYDIKEGEDLQDHEYYQFYSREQLSEFPQVMLLNEFKRKFFSNINFWLSNIEESFFSDINSLSYLGPLRVYPERVFSNYSLEDPENDSSLGNDEWKILLKDDDVRNKVNSILSDTFNLPYYFNRKVLVDSDKLLEIINHKDLMEELVNDGSADGIISMLGDRSSDDFIERLHLIHRESSVKLTTRDVGLGVSQLLPIIVSSVISEKKLIAIEQPELHLHPALQSDLSDMFIESAGENGNQIIIETHSEHLLLRFMRRIRESANDDQEGGLSPKDVGILYVKQDGSNSVVLPLELDEEGHLLDPWPGGFFEEGYKERFS